MFTSPVIEFYDRKKKKKKKKKKKQGQKNKEMDKKWR